MKVWITAKTHYRGAACVHGLSEENQHVRLLQPNGSYPSKQGRDNVGQVWDLIFHPSPNLIPPHIEDVIITRWKQLDEEPDLRNVLLERVTPWRGGPDQLFNGYLRHVIHAPNVFLSERDAYPHGSMGYWLPDRPLIAWHDKPGWHRYRYWSPTAELVTDYTGFAEPPFKLPEQTLLHVALDRWWTPSNTLAPDESSRVERRCYLSIAGWYL